MAACGGMWRPVAPCGGLWQNGLAAPIETFSRKSGIGGDDDGRIQDWRDDDDENEDSDECEMMDD